MNNNTLPPPDLLVDCAQGFVSGYTADTVRRLLAEARAQEREACLQLCRRPAGWWSADQQKAVDQIMSAIRARGDSNG